MMDAMTERATPLAMLVRRVNESGMSFRDMAARARRAGHRISHSQLADIAADDVSRAPSDEQLRAIAAALDTGYEQVRAAMMEQFYGYVPRELKNRRGSRISAVVPDLLPAEDEEELTRLIEAWLAARRRGSHRE